MKIIDGHTGEPHVTSTEIAAYNQAITGREDAVLQIANEFEATQLSNTEIQIDSGVAIIGGIRCGNVDNTENVTLDAGTPGAWRHDLIVIRYTKDPETLVEDCALVAIKGENGTQATAVDPEYEQGDILQGAEVRDFPLYRVIFDGATIDSVTPLFIPTKSLKDATDITGSTADFIVERNGSNSWDYIKTETGIALAWRRVEFTDKCNLTNGIGNYHGDTHWYWQPLGDTDLLFVEPPRMFISLVDPTKATQDARKVNVTNQRFEIQPVSSVSDATSRSYKFDVFAIGLWK